MKKQRGVSLGGLLVVVVALIVCVLFGFIRDTRHVCTFVGRLGFPALYLYTYI